MRTRRLAAVLAATAAALASLTAAAPRQVESPGTTPSATTVTVYGRDGSFGATPDALPSGQTLTRRAVPGWSFPPGQRAYRTALAGDGTVFMAGLGYNVGRLPATSDELTVAAYRPDTNAYTTVHVPTSVGRDRTDDGAGHPVGASVYDLEPVADGRAVAFTAHPAHAGQSPANDGTWPAFGVLTNVDGRWQVARANQWTEAELTGSVAGTRPAECTARGCGGFTEMAGLPRSRDLIVARPEAAEFSLVALRLTGPDEAGRFHTRTTAEYRYPRVPDRGTADIDDHLGLAVRGLQADPTSRAGDERFLLTLEVASDNPAGAPWVVQEFSYDAAAGRIRPVSPPVIPGDRTTGGNAFFGYQATLYDAQGNLWATRIDGLQGGKLAVYANVDGVRGPGGPACPYDAARPMDSYVTSDAGGTVWGRACRPDYDILQARPLLGALGLAEDPSTGDVVSVTLAGALLPVRRAGVGRNLTFRIGNVVDLGGKLLPSTVGDVLTYQFGAVDTAHRLWLVAMHSRPDAAGLTLDQWLYSVDVGRLFEPEPVPISGVPGRTTIVQAEHTLTGTTTQRKGRGATVDVDSDAYLAPCSNFHPNIDCGYDGSPGDGFALADDTGYGFRSGSVEYRVRVADAGDYRLAYRVATFDVSTSARIEMTVGGQAYVTPAHTDGSWHTVVESRLLALPAGEHTIRLSVPDRGGGWYLNWFSLQRA
jgi:hypothetical protein